MKKFLILVAILYGVYYCCARFTFADILVYTKKNPSASWAPAADYYAGMVYYQRNQYAKSQEAFTQLLTDYPTGQYVAKALLRLSEVAEGNRDWPVARQSLERLIEEFPNHSDIRVAEKRLELVKFR